MITKKNQKVIIYFIEEYESKESER
jgi:hypothetical protein